MNILWIFLLNLSFFYLIYKILKLNKILLYKSHNLSHKKKHIEKEIVLIGGVYFIIILTVNILFFFEYNNNFSRIIFFLLPIVMLGFAADFKDNFSAKTRLLAFFFISVFFILNSQIFIKNIDFKIIDNLLKYNLFSIIFFSCCICILINGINFIDGIHGNVIFTFLLIHCSLYLIIDDQNFRQFLLSLIISGVIFLIFNLNEKVFLGDNGSYVIGFYISGLLIYSYDTFNLNSFYIAGLVIYPVTEVAWSVTRRITDGKNAFYPDNFHLHNIISYYFENCKNSKIQSLCSSLLILIFNSIFIYLITIFNSNKADLIKTISFYILTYITIYIFFRLSFFSRRKK